jgi:hypothetical protein
MNHSEKIFFTWNSIFGNNCQMAVTSYRRGRTVQWDEKREEIDIV